MTCCCCAAPKPEATATEASRGSRARDRCDVQNKVSFGCRAELEQKLEPERAPYGASIWGSRLGCELALVDGEEADAEADEPRDAARILAAIESFARTDSLTTCAGIWLSAPLAASRSNDASDAIP